MSKVTALILTLIFLAPSIIIVGSVSGVTTKLSTPEFTVTYIDHSYDIPAHTTTDPYTGKIIENPVTHIDNRTIQFSFKNTIAPERGQLYYLIRMKGHFSENWTNIYKGEVNTSEPEAIIWAFSTTGEPGRFYLAGVSFKGPSAGQVDFQVQAQTWGEVMSETTATNPFGGSITTLFGESDWSSTQTITIGDNSTTPTVLPSPSSATIDPSASPLQPNIQSNVLFALNWEQAAMVVLGVLVVLLIAVLVYSRKKKTKPPAMG